ncbi:tripartite motif-containing protein 16-like [Pholidichthys leucotaenia]
MDYLKAGSSGLSAASAEPEDVTCDFCTGGRKRKASKSCLTCMTSYCKGHLDDHNSATPLKRHKLVKPTSKLQKGVCPRHDEKMEIFCRTDQQCICYLCLKDGHKGHDIVTVKAERDERVKDREHQDKILQRIKDREEDVTKLQQRVEAINVSADKAAEDNKKMLKELISHINKQTAEIKQKIRSQEKTETSRVKELQEKIQQQITELKKKITELEQLPSSSTENDVQFLRTYSLLSHLSEYTKVPSANNLTVHYFNEVTAAASKLRDTVQSLLGDFPKPPPSVTKVGELMSLAEPKTRDEFLKHACQITLDPNTMSTHLSLTKMSTKKASFCSIEQSYPSHSERFTESKQILSREGLTGCCYWEVKLSGVTMG